MLKPLHEGGKVDFKVKAGQKWNDILECSALFIWKYEESLYENKQIGKNHKSAFQTCYHYFPTRALILIRWNETLNTSPPVTPSFRRAIRKCFWICDSVFLSSCNVQIPLFLPASFIVYISPIWHFIYDT